MPFCESLAQLFCRQALALVKLGYPLANARHKLNFLGDFHQGRFLGQVPEQIYRDFLIAHGSSLPGRCLKASSFR